MHVVISEIRLLTALHDVGLTTDLFSLDHHFHVADIFINQRDIDPQDLELFLARGLIVDELTSGETLQLKNLRRQHPSLCVGNAASLALSAAKGYPILAGNTGLATLGNDVGHTLLDICWIMDQLQPRVSPDRMLQCFEAIVISERRHLYSPEVASRIQEYEVAVAVNMP